MKISSVCIMKLLLRILSLLLSPQTNFLWNLVPAMDHYVAVKNYNSGRLNMKMCLWYVHWIKQHNIDSNYSHVKLFVSADKDRKLIGKDENYMRAMGLEMFWFFQKILFAVAQSFQLGEKRNLVTEKSLMRNCYVSFFVITRIVYFTVLPLFPGCPKRWL